MTSGDKRKIIFIVDDEADVREAISMVLVAAGYEVHSFNVGQVCLQYLEDHDCDLLISDVSMPEMDGLVLLDKAREIHPELMVMLVTGVGDVPMAVRAMKLGAAEFVEKPLRREELLNKVEFLMDWAQRRGGIEAMTEAEQEILKYIAQGKSNKVIALELGRSVRTIEVHRSHIMKKLQVENSTDLLRKLWKSVPQDKSQILPLTTGYESREAKIENEDESDNRTDI
jgi:FixJ family two-component response regulator